MWRSAKCKTFWKTCRHPKSRTAALAQMLLRTGNSVGARAAVEEILAEDAGHVEALKLKAGWQIDDDQVGDAILASRRA